MKILIQGRVQKEMGAIRDFNLHYINLVGACNYHMLCGGLYGDLLNRDLVGQ